MPLLPRRSAPFVFAFLLSGFMTFIVSGIATLVAIGLAPSFTSVWVTAWLIAFPALTVIRPLVTRMVDRLTG